MTVDVVVCAHNEAPRIGPVLEAIKGSPWVGQLIVVADACDDDTAAVALGYTDTLVPIAARDKGTAMATGLAHVTTELVTFIDADLTGLQPGHVTALCSYPPELGQVVGIRGVIRGVPTPRPLGLWPPISGERRVPAELARSAGLAGSGWQAETLLNVAVARSHLPWRHIILEGVSNPTKVGTWGWVDELARVTDATAIYGPELARYMTHPNG